jgi:LPS O-antigen subunit length determinant protein (WzzB/FepE family)
MAKKPKSSDVNVTAFEILQAITKNLKQEEPKKNPAAVALGRLGGLKGGKARADALSKKRKIEIATKAAKARWSK